MAGDHLYPARLWLQRISLLIPLALTVLGLRQLARGSDGVGQPGLVLGIAVVALLVALCAFDLTQLALRSAAPAESVDDAFWQGVLTSDFLKDTSSVGTGTCALAAVLATWSRVREPFDPAPWTIGLSAALVLFASAAVGLRTGEDKVPRLIQRYGRPVPQP